MEIMKVGSIRKNEYAEASGLSNDLLITVRTRKNDEVPYFLLYQCSEGRPTGFSSIAQIKITAESPRTIDDITPLYISPNITNECKNAILAWSKDTDIRGTSNWDSLIDKYTSINEEICFE